MSKNISQEVIAQLQAQFSTKITGTTSFHGDETALVAFDSLHDVLYWCKDVLKFDLLLDITAIDQGFDAKNRFEISYVLTRAEEGTNILIRTELPAEEAPTSTDLWTTADWHEREIYDLMGITFLNHPDMRRLLMWEGYPYHPLRKDFPLAGLPTELPEVAEAKTAPWEGGPFTAVQSDSCAGREPRAKG